MIMEFGNAKLQNNFWATPRLIKAVCDRLNLTLETIHFKTNRYMIAAPGQDLHDCKKKLNSHLFQLQKGGSFESYRLWLSQTVSGQLGTIRLEITELDPMKPKARNLN